MSELTRKPLQIWSCKIGECPEASLPIAADSPMRDAVAEAYTRISGHEPAFIFSGWNADLTEGERAAHESRIPTDFPPTRWSDEYVSDLQQRITQQAQELEGIDDILARRPALADCVTRRDKIETAINTASKADDFQRQLAAMTRERDDWQKIATGWADGERASDAAAGGEDDDERPPAWFVPPVEEEETCCIPDPGDKYDEWVDRWLERVW